MCQKPIIESQKVEIEQFVVKADNNVADIDDVINVLNVLTNSDRELNYFNKPEATNYLKAANLIEEPSPNSFKVKDLEGCRKLNDYLSNFMDDIIDRFGLQPDVLINSKHKE